MNLFGIKKDTLIKTQYPWIGKIPKHWETVPLRAVIGLKSIKNQPELELLSVYRDYGVILKSSRDDNHNATSQDTSGYKVVKKGDLVVNKMKAWQGSMGVSEYNGIVSPAYITCSVDHELISPRYLHFLLRSQNMISLYRSLSYGVRIGQWDMHFEDFKKIQIPLPPLEEQIEIAQFLDTKIRKIDEILLKRRKIIESLELEKKMIIDNACTRGVDNIEFVDTDIPWLKEVPRNWKTFKIKHLAKRGYKTFVDGDWVELPHIKESGIRLIQTGNVGRGEYRDKGFRYIDENSFKELNCTEVFPGDVLICRLDGPVGRACIAPDLGTRMITSVDNAILKSGDKVVPRFLVYLLSSESWLNWIGSICRAGGGFRFRISRTILGNQQVALPSLDEQEKIVKIVDKKISEIDNILDKQIKIVEKIENFKKSFTYHSVTGKVQIGNMK